MEIRKGRTADQIIKEVSEEIRKLSAKGEEFELSLKSPVDVGPEITPEEAAEVVAEIKAQVAVLLATQDLKQAIAGKIAEAHELLHKAGPAMSLVGYMTTLLEPAPVPENPDETEEGQIENLKGWISHVGSILRSLGETSHAVCFTHNRLESGMGVIPGRQKADSLVTADPGGDFSQFIGKLMPPGEA